MRRPKTSTLDASSSRARDNSAPWRRLTSVCTWRGQRTGQWLQIVIYWCLAARPLPQSGAVVAAQVKRSTLGGVAAFWPASVCVDPLDFCTILCVSCWCCWTYVQRPFRHRGPGRIKARVLRSVNRLDGKSHGWNGPSPAPHEAAPQDSAGHVDESLAQIAERRRRARLFVFFPPHAPRSSFGNRKGDE